MSTTAPVVAVGLGALTPVGLTAEASCAALRAGIARLAEVPAGEAAAADAANGDGEPLIGGRVPTEWLRPTAGDEPPLALPVPPGETRLRQLAVPAAREALTDAALGGTERLGLYVALGEGEAPAFVRALAGELAPAPRLGAAFPKGRAGIFPAIARAAHDLAEGTISRALVGGVDSLLRPDVRARAAANVGGDAPAGDPASVVPGECAAFLVLSRAADAHAVDRVHLLGVATADEPTAGTETPSAAEGLTQALRATCTAGEPIAAPPLVVCDLNGERYRALEWTMAAMRVVGPLGGARDLWHPADCIGDTGAGAGALALVWAVTALRRDYAGTSDVLVWGASEGPLRGSVRLHGAAT